jgi:CBS domain-containing protein
MICPDCGYDNIEGVDLCETCGQPLVDVESAGSELEESISRHNIDVLPTKTPVLVSSTTSVREAVDEMVSHRLGCVLVVDNEELVGIFTERDLLNKVSADLHELDRPVSDLMTSSPETITKQDSIAYALHAMDLGGYRHIPIVDSQSKLPTGVISIRDILRFLCIRFAKLRSGS